MSENDIISAKKTAYTLKMMLFTFTTSLLWSGMQGGPICKIVKHSSLLLGLGPWLSSTWLGGVVGLLCHADRCELEGTRQFPLIGSGKGCYIYVCVGGS